jgi:hypothetical protein
MPTFQTLLSGGWRISSISNLITKNFSNITTCSTYNMQEVVVLPGVSEFVVSLPLFSAPVALFMQATNTIRINFSGVGSGVSAASAGVIQFKEGFHVMSQSGGLPSGLHFSNSGSDSSVIALLIAG